MSHMMVYGPTGVNQNGGGRKLNLLKLGYKIAKNGYSAGQIGNKIFRVVKNLKGKGYTKYQRGKKKGGKYSKYQRGKKGGFSLFPIHDLIYKFNPIAKAIKKIKDSKKKFDNW